MIACSLLVACASSGGPQTTTGQSIPRSGGSAVLEGVATIVFPAGSFERSHSVTVTRTTAADDAANFDEASAVYQAEERAAFEVRVRTGDVAPAHFIDATLHLPDGFVVGPESTAQLFARLYQPGEGALYNFELYPSHFDRDARTVQAQLQREVFSAHHRSDGEYEAVILIATTPRSYGLLASVNRADAAQGQCSGTTFAPPLEGTISVSGSPPRHFNPGGTPHPITGVTTSHRGVDLVAAEGASVLAVADGTVRAVGNQFNAGTGTGWGNYVVLDFAGGAVLYGHLQDDSVQLQPGQTVTRGDVIARAGQTGGATGPHLHFEYAPNGEIFDNSAKVDPLACIDAGEEADIAGTWSGTWTSIDSGNTGPMTWVITQVGGTLSGSESDPQGGCGASQLSLTGTIVGTTVSVRTSAPGYHAQYSAVLRNANSLVGAWTVSGGTCDGVRGGLTLTRQ